MQFIKRIAEKVATLVTGTVHPKVEEVILALQMNNNTASSHDGKTRKVFYLAEYTDPQGTVHCVPLYAFEDFCLNAVYVDSKGMPRISPASVGGSVFAKDTSLTKAVDSYAGLGKLGQIIAC